MNNQAIKIYFVLCICFLMMTFFEPFPLRWIFKIGPIIVLIVIMKQKCKGNKPSLFIMGLIFSLIGDFFLEYDRLNWFIYGLASFLVAHIFYIAAMLPIHKRKYYYITPYILYGFVMFNVLSSSLGELYIPVLIYMFVLLCMGITTLISKYSNLLLILGGLCFVLSDSLIGINRFTINIPYAAFLIMLTYYLAQFLLVKGFLKKSL